MPTFIVHAKGFVLEAAADLLRSRGVVVIEAPTPASVASHLAAEPDAVLVCDQVPPADRWRCRRVVLLDGVADEQAAGLAAQGAFVTRSGDGSVAGLLEAAFQLDPATDAGILRQPSTSRREPELLSPRQLDVVRLIARGHTSQEIAVALGVRPKTVENYKQRLFVRLGVQNQAHAVARCARSGLLGDRPAATMAS